MNMIESIVTFEDLEDFGDEYVVVSNAKFITDFGPFSEGEEVRFLQLHYADQKLEEFDEGGNVVRSVRVKLVLDV